MKTSFFSKSLAQQIDEKLNQAFISDTERQRVMSTKRKLLEECGCSHGGITAIVSVCFFSAYLKFFAIFHSSRELLMAILTGFAFTLGFSIAGKLVGIMVARIRLLFLLVKLSKYSKPLKEN